MGCFALAVGFPAELMDPLPLEACTTCLSFEWLCCERCAFICGDGRSYSCSAVLLKFSLEHLGIELLGAGTELSVVGLPSK